MIITRLITSKGRVTSFLQAVEEAVKEGGIASLYKGITAYVRACLRASVRLLSLLPPWWLAGWLIYSHHTPTPHSPHDSSSQCCA